MEAACSQCGRLPFRRGLCVTCYRQARQAGPVRRLRPVDEVIEDVEWMIATGETHPETVAARLGYLDDRTSALSQLPLIAPLVMIVIVAGGPVLYPLVLRGWTALVPASASASWYLARHQARYHLARSTASITPRLELTLTRLPLAMPSSSASAAPISTNCSGWVIALRRTCLVQ